MLSEHPLSDYGWNERARALASDYDPGLRPGRVARVDRGALAVVTEQGTQHVPSRGLHATTGDWVLMQRSDPPAVEVVLPRWSALGRDDPGEAAVTQLLAANVDVGFAVEGLDRGPNVGRLQRLLTLVWSSGATPVIVLTKADLVATPSAVAAGVEADVPGTEVVVASTVSGEGVSRLRALVPQGQTAVLLGESGAGKSSLVNALTGSDVQATAAVRKGHHKGKHTTRARELVPIPGGGVLLDTPGIRAVGLVAGQQEGLDRTFADIVALTAQCRFRDCRHDSEPGCAVQAAVAEGRLDARRLASYRRLEQEVASAAGRADARAERAAAKQSARRDKRLEDDVGETERYR